MPYNASGESFLPNGGPFAVFPVLTEAYAGLTTAQCAANNALSSASVTATSGLVEAATPRNTMTIIVPTDQPAVTFGNQNALAGVIAAPPVSPPALTETFSPPSSGFTVAPGVSIQLAPYDDDLYAIVPAGTATVYFMDT